MPFDARLLLEFSQEIIAQEENWKVHKLPIYLFARNRANLIVARKKNFFILICINGETIKSSAADFSTRAVLSITANMTQWKASFFIKWWHISINSEN